MNAIENHPSISPDTTIMEAGGKIYSRHIEEPQQPFMVRVLKAPVFNVFYRPAQWKMYTVLAATAAGAMKIAKYHFYRAEKIEFLGEL